MNGAISWFARNGVAANLLMVLILFGGVVTVNGIKREIFPEIPSRMISVSVLYPGAAPEEVEEAICIRIEEAVGSLEGVKRLSSTASENQGLVRIEAIEGTDTRQLLDDVKSRVDAIDTFPQEAEQPVITEVQTQSQVINVAVSAEMDEASLRTLGERVRDDLLALPGVTQATLVGARAYEISIEVSETALRRWGLTFDQVAAAVRRSSLDLPGGSIKARGGEILLRTKGQAYVGRDFESIPVLSRPDGSKVVLGDIAHIVDGFEDVDQITRFDGRPSVMVQVFRVGEQDALKIAEAIHAYIADSTPQFPAGVTLTAWQDDSQLLRGRQELLIRNGRTGFVLVFFVLALFLKLRLAFWVSMGIPISFLGALWLMPTLGASISMISLFAFIIVLGIVVDDAIVTGENIYRHHEAGSDGLKAAIDGTHEVAVPVTFAVLTTVAAFAPLLFVPGRIGQIMATIPLIVIPTLLFSLVESKLILPYHLSHLPRNTKPRTGLRGAWNRVQKGVASTLRAFVQRVYTPSLDFAIRWRYHAVAVFLFLLLGTVGLIAGGRIKFIFFPNVEADLILADVTLPNGTPFETTLDATRQLEASLATLRGELAEEGREDPILHVLSSTGDQPLATDQANNGPNGNTGATFFASNRAEIAVELLPAEERDGTSLELARRWRELTGTIPDAVELTFRSSIFSAGDPINVQFAGPNMAELEAVAERVKERLSDYAGVFDISDSYLTGKQEVQLTLKPGAESLGLTHNELARQVRQAFYGEEVQRIQRGRDEIKVMVRFPAGERRSLGDLERMRIRTSSGEEVPFSAVAEVQEGRGFASITRTDRRRTLSVTADVDLAKANPGEILADLQSTLLPEILAAYPRVRYSFEGEQEEQRQTMGGLRRGFLIALIVIYALMAIPFRSYLQPLIVMSAIPFGLIGAVWGHVLRGIDISIVSMFGIVALTGVVVNDSIVLVDYINRKRREGLTVTEAVLTAGPARFRAILLTTLTTMAGLTPMILERSLQAQFLVPIAISLAFGVGFSTLIILILVPVGYVILDDLKRLPGRVSGTLRKERSAA